MHRLLLVVAVAAAVTWPTGPATAWFRSPWPTVDCADDPALLAAREGGVYRDDGTITLRLEVCRRLGELQAGRPVSDERYEALQLLAHELSHAGGYGHHDPETTYCHAVRILLAVGRHLQLPAATLRQLAVVRAGWWWQCPRRLRPAQR